MIRFFCALSLLLCFLGCAGTKNLEKNDDKNTSIEMLQDSLRAKFILKMPNEKGELQELDAVLFSVPGKRYRLEMTGPLGVGVASLLWTESGWNIVFPTEKTYISGNGYMIGILGSDELPMVSIHQLAGFFEGVLIPKNSKILSENIEGDTRNVLIEAPNGMQFDYREKAGKITSLAQKGRSEKQEVLKFSNFKMFNEIEIPENIVFEQNGKPYLSINIKRITKNKSFSPGTWRLNIPKSYKKLN